MNNFLIGRSLLTLFAFESRVLKSHLLIDLILKRAENGLVVCIDCAGDISRGISSSIQLRGNIPKSILKNIIIFQTHDFSDQGRLVVNIVTRLSSPKVDTLVVDPITYHYRIAISGYSSIEKTHELNNQMGLLKIFARETRSRVIVTSLLTSDPESGKLHLTASNILAFWSDILVAFTSENAYVLKHPYLPKLKLNFRKTI